MKMLDTNIIIYLMRYQPEYLIQRFDSEKNKGLCISAVTLGELREGVEKSTKRQKNEGLLTEILRDITVFPFEDNAAYEYGKICASLYKSGFTVGKLDMQIAACAIANNVTLVTNNIKDFRNISGLSIEDWIIR